MGTLNSSPARKSNASRPSNSSAEFRFAPVCDDLASQVAQQSFFVVFLFSVQGKADGL